MDTTVTGIFPNQDLAALAITRLVQAGFAAEKVHVVDGKAPDRHEFIDSQTSDTKRAVVLGVLFGTVGGVVAGGGLSLVFGLPHWTLIGGIAIAIGGTVLGFLVGRATTTQVADELEHQVESGTVLVSVTTDTTRGPEALTLLTKEGEASIISTAATYTASVLPANHVHAAPSGA